MSDLSPDIPVSGEEALVQTYLAPLAANYAGAFGLLDDCAALSLPTGHDLVVKTDPVRAGVHFFADDDPADIAWKALAVNVSDLVAKGATPLAYVAALSFPAAPTPAWLRAFADGLGAAQSAFGCHLVGGDTDRVEGPISIAITAFGSVPTGRMIRRGAARAGDILYVSGDLGASAIGLKIRRGDADTTSWSLGASARQALLGRYLRPMPRVRLATAVLKHARASMDISDGLHKDADRMCRASGVGCHIDLAKLPLSDGVRALTQAHRQLRPLIWSAGDDYEVLCAIPPDQAKTFEQDAVSANVPITAIGIVTAERSVALLDETGQLITGPAKGWDHF